MTGQISTLEYINGQLKTWEYVNRKRNYGIEFYLRDMSRPYRGQQLPVDPSCIRNCFQTQLLEFVESGTPNSVSELDISYVPVNWQDLSDSLLDWIFKYMNDQVGHCLSDPADAFESSDIKFQESIAQELVNQIQAATLATTLQMAHNSSKYFCGLVVLLQFESNFYELRLGTHF